MASEPAASGLAQKVKHKAYPVQEWGGLVWAYMGPQRDDAGVPAAGLGADRQGAREHRQGAGAVQLGADARGRDRLGAQLEPALVRHGAGARRQRRGDRQDLAAPVDRQGAAHAGAAHAATASATRRCAGRSPTPRRNDYVRSTVFVAPATALIPPNNLYNVANINVPMDDTNTAFYFIAWGHPAQTPRDRDLAQVPAPDGRRRPRRDVPAAAHASTTSSGRTAQAMKAGNFTGITGFPEPGHRDVGDHGPDRRPHAATGSAPATWRSSSSASRCSRRCATSWTASRRSAPATRRSRPTVCAFQAIVPKTTDWRSYEATLRLGTAAPARRSSRRTRLPA